MPKKNAAVHLLLLDPSQNDAEKVVSLLRNAGRATRAHRVTSSEDLDESLTNQAWDLFIAKEADGELGYHDCLKAIKKYERDIPFILIMESLDEEACLKALKEGARDVIPAEAMQRLVLIALRELDNLEDRRQRRNLEGYLREAEKRCNLLLESSMDAIAYVNEGMHVHANAAYLELFGYDDVDDMICIPLMDVIAPESQDTFKTFIKAFNDGQSQHDELPCKVAKEDGSEVEVIINFSEASYDGESCTQLIMRPEVDPELEEKLRKISSEDLLTGLLNKAHFTEQLKETIDHALKGELVGSLLYIELDEFDAAQTDYGMAGADTILTEVARIIRTESNERYMVARMGDETFAVLTPGLEGKDAEAFAESLRKKIGEQLIEVGDRTAQITASIGLVRINENAPETDELISRAYRAAAHAQEEGSKGTGVYMYNSVDFSEDTGSTEDLLVVLQQALDNNRFKLLFQPIIGLRGEGDEHYEAFLRMLDEEDKEISPSQFLPIESHSELAIKLDRWVILQNIKSLSSHRSQGHDTKLFITVTPHTVVDKGFVEWLSLALKAAKLPGSSLIFQMGEDEAIETLKQAKDFCDGLHKLGCKVSLSRFGCALNPFNTLKHIEADYVKLDGSYTEELQKDQKSKEGVIEMVAQLQEMDKLTIVPFVESASILSTLWQAGVNYIQGYYLQEPTTEMNYDFSEGD